MDIAKNIEEIKNNISEAAIKRGVKAEDITLIAVTKTYGVDTIINAYERGILHFGENKVQELLTKFDHLPNEISWHLIGHLQRNKVKYIANKVTMIHSLESVKLAAEIDKEAKKHNRIIDTLVEINIGSEISKYGININEAEEFINEVSIYDNIRIKGLMCIAPFVENPEDNAPLFRNMRNMFDYLKEKNIKNVSMEYLSMGMSNDYEVAILEGSNMVRIGSLIFGQRDYSN